MKFHLFLTLECQQSVAMFLFCLQQHDGWGLPQMTAVFFPLFLIHMSSDEKSEISSNSPSTSQYPDVFPPWRNPSFLHGIFSTLFSLFLTQHCAWAQAEPLLVLQKGCKGLW